MIKLITTSKPARWALSGMVLAGIACAVLAASATAGAQTAATTTPRCKTSGLSVWLGVGSGGGAAGSIITRWSSQTTRAIPASSTASRASRPSVQAVRLEAPQGATTPYPHGR